MRIVERLGVVGDGSPEIDTATDGRGRALRRRRQRTRAGLGALVVLVVIGALVVRERDGRTLDTVGPAQATPVRYLPADVPPGFELAWVDTREGPVVRPAQPEPWTAGAPSAYVYGYRSETAELDVDVFPGYTLDADAIARSWRQKTSDDDVDIRVVSGERGRRAVVSERPTTVLAALEIEGATVLVSGHGLGPANTTVSFHVIDELVRSFRVVEEREWSSVIASADVSPPSGPRGAGETLIAGEGWLLQAIPYRRPRWTTQPALALTVGDTSSLVGDEPPQHFADREPLDGDVIVDLLRDGDRTVAWGLAPATAATVRLGFAGRSVVATTVPFGQSAAFAVEVGDAPGEPDEIVALDRDGRSIYAFAGQLPGDAADCGVEAAETVDVPDVVGLSLGDAIRAVEAAGLSVVGTGTPPGDPTDGAIITAQEPPAGTSVPAGSCIGFRTG